MTRIELIDRLILRLDLKAQELAAAGKPTTELDHAIAHAMRVQRAIRAGLRAEL